MISSDIIRGYNDMFILAILNEGDSYGYEISKQLADYSENEYVIKETTLYSAFVRLKKKGYIESYPGQVTEGGKRTYYRITDEGREFLKEKLQEWDVTKRVVEAVIEKSQLKERLKHD